MKALLISAALTLLLPLVPAQEIDFTKDIQPIFAARCYKCHGPQKQKGKLRLDRWNDAMSHGEHPVLKPGDAKSSSLMERVTLDADDPDFMPKSGKPLAKEEIEKLSRWIAAGAKWPKDAAADDADARWNARFDVGELNAAAKAAGDKAIEAVRKAGGLAGPIAANTGAVDVNLSLMGDQATDETLAMLKGLEPTLVWLNLSRTKVTDEGLTHLAGHKRLLRLHLARTQVTDAALAHLAQIENLEFLNLYGTAITDTGLAHLKGLKKLKKLFLWQTKVTEAGAATLAKEIPECVIDRGNYAKPAPVAAKPKPVNTTCPIANRPVNASFTATHEEQVIAFCCGNCLATFKKDPKAHIGKVKGFKPKPVNAKCPVSGQGVDPAHTLVHEGKTVGFCCPKCVAAFKKEPQKYAAKLK